ncbi:hypothetical protein GALMADRAFT_230657 [Galerina marginata CBS 339.88]|uniref:Uncharacterized protein n=1 Tax=Galerina marginata (strain CBS 339.88) TaxID=685588 RepID=A0A067SRJ9_GALM3|nr:hypothetical protein GALMADRAFT_230657 [Galerina marginata CBS 339.88]
MSNSRRSGQSLSGTWNEFLNSILHLARYDDGLFLDCNSFTFSPYSDLDAQAWHLSTCKLATGQTSAEDCGMSFVQGCDDLAFVDEERLISSQSLSILVVLAFIGPRLYGRNQARNVSDNPITWWLQYQLASDERGTADAARCRADRWSQADGLVG